MTLRSDDDKKKQITSMRPYIISRPPQASPPASVALEPFLPLWAAASVHDPLWASARHECVRDHEMKT